MEVLWIPRTGDIIGRSTCGIGSKVCCGSARYNYIPLRPVTQPAWPASLPGPRGLSPISPLSVSVSRDVELGLLCQQCRRRCPSSIRVLIGGCLPSFSQARSCFVASYSVGHDRHDPLWIFHDLQTKKCSLASHILLPHMRRSLTGPPTGPLGSRRRPNG